MVINQYVYTAQKNQASNFSFREGSSNQDDIWFI